MSDTFWVIYMIVGILPAIAATHQSIETTNMNDDMPRRGEASATIIFFFFMLFFWPVWVVKEVVKLLIKKDTR